MLCVALAGCFNPPVFEPQGGQPDAVGDGSVADSATQPDTVAQPDGVGTPDGVTQPDTSTGNEDRRPYFRVGATYASAPFDETGNAQLQANLGFNATHRKYPIPLFVQWGYGSEASKVDGLVSAGMSDVAVYLIGAPDGETTAAAGASDESAIPTNLYEPIWLNAELCQINPENTWANHVFQIMQEHKNRVDLWGVWVYPDGADASVQASWTTQVPAQGQLSNLKNGDIFSYVRMLRIVHEAKVCAAPETRVTPGILLTTTFLSAILRYTDQPGTGGVTPDYPKSGGAYIDAVQYQYVPQGPSQSDPVADALVQRVQSLRDTLSGSGLQDVPLYITGYGIPSDDTVSSPSGTAVAANGFIKSVLLGWAQGLWGLEWRYLTDGSSSGTRDPTMGMYAQDPATPTAEPKAVGRSLQALVSAIGLDAKYERAATEALSLPNNVKGVAFTKANGKKAMALWVNAVFDEDGAETVTVPTPGGGGSYTLWVGDNSSAPLQVTDGSLKVSITSSPSYVVED